MQKETRFKVKFRKRLEKIPKSEWVKTQFVALRGEHDFFGCVNGHCVTLELKTLEGKASKLQLWRRRRWKQAGAFSEVVDPSNADAIISQLEAL